MKVALGALRTSLFSLAILFSVGAVAQGIDIEKFTNGQDADTAPGPIVPVGSTVTWTYVVTNTGERPIGAIVVTDDQGVTVTCPDDELDAGTSFTCTATGTAIAGQYVNVGSVTATRQDSTTATDSDPSHYFGQDAVAIAIEKRTNGQDADTPPGPTVAVGSTVTWTYLVTNVGNEALSDVTVTDDQGVTVTCPDTTLAVGASMTCTASGTAIPGQYTNIGLATATRETSLDTVIASDPSHYFGRTLQFVKRTNGVDATAPPGPFVETGSTVTWTYEVTNPGPGTLTNLTVTDDQGVTVTCPQTTLAERETVTCTATGIAEPGQYTNVATATATTPAGDTISATDTSYYFGNPLDIEKLTNGVDADEPPGISVNAGDPVNWTYIVTNNSGQPLTNVSVSDDQGVTVTCPDTTLAAGASMTCTASGTAIAGQYSNLGTATATLPDSSTLTATDPSHYFGQTSPLDFGDAPDPTFPTRFASDGARHLIADGVYLGACVDAEADSLATAGAGADDTTVGPATGTCAVPGDDADGVGFTTQIRIGRTSTVDVTASAPCTLSAWIDFSADGDWNDAGENLFPGGTPLVTGVNDLTFTVPADAVAGTTYARFRCATSGALATTGQASNGEVEDYQVTIFVPVVSVAATKTDALVVDVDGDSQVDPGDTVRYTVTISNSGNDDAVGVVFNDTPDANTALVVGSVTTTQGSVTTGNSGGDSSVSVNLGTVIAFGSATITFDVTIDNPLPSGVTSVSNQGNVSGSNFTAAATDDPAEGGTSDPTVTQLSVPPDVSATKTDALFTDQDSDGVAEPGDTIAYTVVITNGGTGSATNVVFSDTPDANTTLVVGSVTTTQGTVTAGNNPGDASVSVNVGTIAGGASVTITFRVTIDDPAPDGLTSVSNQGSVSGDNFTAVATDDPGAAGSSDPTVTAITIAPIVSASKSVALQTDTDSDGRPDAGDTLRYTVIVRNTGTGNALAVQFNDTPDPNTALVVGSVTTTQGSVTIGNTPGSTTVSVNVGTIAPGATVTITFDVTIDDPLPPGVNTISNSGTVSGSNFDSVSTDDPSQPGGSDPTVIALAAGVAIPTLQTWALLALLSVLGIVALRRLA